VDSPEVTGGCFKTYEQVPIVARIELSRFRNGKEGYGGEILGISTTHPALCVHAWHSRGRHAVNSRRSRVS